jgi:hypothetical protein
MWAGVDATPARPCPGPDDNAELLAPIPGYDVPMPGPLGAFLAWIEQDGLPCSLGAGAGLGALASMCGAAVIEQGSMHARPSLWCALVGGPSCGKSAVVGHASEIPSAIYADARNQYEAGLSKWEPAGKNGPAPAPPAIVSTTDPTIEAVARMLRSNGLAGAGYTGAIVSDELDAYLSGLGRHGQSRDGGGFDRAKLREIWTGASTHILRVGSGGKVNEVDIFVPTPALSIYGALLPGDLDKLGRDARGDRARWLIHLSPQARPSVNPRQPKPGTWVEAFAQLAEVRGRPRTWTIHGAAFNVLQRARERWHAAELEPWPAHVIQALRKADNQALRIALVLAESMDPGAGGHVPPAAMEAAVVHVDYSLDCWRALDGGEPFALSRADEKMHNGIEKLRTWLEDRPAMSLGLPEDTSPRPGATRRDIHRAQPAGIMDGYQLNHVLGAYARRYPGCVVEYKRAHGPASVVVYTPPRGTVGPDSFTPGPYQPVPEIFPGQRGASAPRKTVGSPDRSVSDSSHPTVPPALLSVRCPACRWRFKTALQPGETAWCKQCGHTFTMPKA